MWWRNGRCRRSKDGAPTIEALVDEFEGDDGELVAEIERLSAENGAGLTVEQQRVLLRLRNLLGIRLVEGAGEDPGYAQPEHAGLPDGPLVELPPDRLTPGLLRAGILSHGCVLVRGLVDRRRAAAFAKQIDRAFAERDRYDADKPFADRLYLPFDPDPRRGARPPREWVKSGGGVLAVDSPGLSYEMGELYREAGLPELVAGYLREPPLVSADKTTLRKADPSVGGAWHQDGKFMGPVKALNLWLALSHCGEDAPGLDLVPRRLEQHVTTQTDEAMMLNQVSQRVAEEAAGELPIVRPIFEPGDALLFDELFLHKTASDPRMRKPRYAIENWFFAPSGFPDDYAPLAA